MQRVRLSRVVLPSLRGSRKWKRDRECQWSKPLIPLETRVRFPESRPISEQSSQVRAMPFSCCQCDVVNCDEEQARGELGNQQEGAVSWLSCGERSVGREARRVWLHRGELG